MVHFDSGNANHDLNQQLEAQAHIWNHIFNFINSMSLKCAIQLGIPDAINNHGKPMTLPTLVSTLSINPTKAYCIPRLMRILVHSRFFDTAKIEEDGQELEGYVLTNVSELLLKENPWSAIPFLQAMLDPILTEPWHQFSNWFLNDDLNSFDTFHGKSLWEFAGHNPNFNNFFNEAMASDARLVTNVLVEEGKDLFDGLKSLVDVGGGNGTVAKALAMAFPDLDCFVFDLPRVIDGLQDDGNLKFIEGDMFQDEIPPAEAILLKWIMHDWSDEECIKILKKCREAIKGRNGRKLIIIDMVIGSQKEKKNAIETQLFFDMLMMVCGTGKERNEEEWAKLFLDAGFSDFKITPILGLRSIIEVYP